MSRRYVIKESIGSGGLGVVFRAADSHLDRDVALKRVQVSADASLEDLTASLLQEAKTLSALKDPHIVTVHDVGTDEDGPFVVMELLEGETLDSLIERGHLGVEDFTEFAVQTLEGMIAAQSVHLLHRDLKPANIMIVWRPTGKFQVKILDFGLAKFSRRPTTQTLDHKGSIFGSIYFMAPEQFECLPLDPRSDLYSLGAIFYSTLAGEYPFQGENVAQVMAAHLQHRFIPLKEVRPELPDALCHWVERLMARDMDDRPADARQALAELNPLPVLDEEQAREAASGDPAVAAELLADFTEELDGLMDQLKRELEAGLADRAQITARTIRGTASTLGYSGIISIASEIEKQSSKDANHCRMLCDRFPQALEHLNRAVHNLNWTAPPPEQS